MTIHAATVARYAIIASGLAAADGIALKNAEIASPIAHPYRRM